MWAMARRGAAGYCTPCRRSRDATRGVDAEVDSRGPVVETIHQAQEAAGALGEISTISITDAPLPGIIAGVAGHPVGLDFLPVGCSDVNHG